MSVTDAHRVTSVAVDERGLLVEADGEFPVDVLFDGRHIFSFWLVRDTVPEQGKARFPWPPLLRRFLDGTVTVGVAAPGSTTPWVSAEATLGSGTGRIAIEDAHGNPLGLDKSMRLISFFGDRDPEQLAPLLDAIDDVIGALEKAGIEPFLAYGTLLGAVRQQDFIGHDSDADLGYVSRYEHPADVAAESFRVQRQLRRLGYHVDRYSGLGLKVVVLEADGQSRGLDVFGGFIRDDRLYLMGEVGHPFERDWIAPRSEVTLAGHTYPAPAKPERLLEAMYGPSWRIPDPAYKFTTPVETTRRLDGWFRGTRVGIETQWKRFGDGTEVPARGGPSAFVRWAREQEPAAVAAVDIGCGFGEDALWLAREGVRTVGLDRFPPSIKGARDRAARREVPAVFEWANLDEFRSTIVTGARMARLDGPRMVLARHVLDATDPYGRTNLFRLAKMAASGGGRLYLQVQTTATERSRRLGLNPMSLDHVRELIEQSGGRVEHLASHTEHEDDLPPGSVADDRETLSRMVVSWRG